MNYELVDKVIVYGNDRVYGDVVWGAVDNALDKVIVYGNDRVYDNAQVSGNGGNEVVND